MIECLDLDLEEDDDDDYFIDPDFFEDEVEEVRYCRYCSKVLESEDSTTLFEVDFCYDGEKYYGCRRCSSKFLEIPEEHDLDDI
jgi:hypothetical protein